jgi:hypothetical protein
MFSLVVDGKVENSAGELGIVARNISDGLDSGKVRFNEDKKRLVCATGVDLTSGCGCDSGSITVDVD